jgi:methyl-accepting chemotaxis protein
VATSTNSVRTFALVKTSDPRDQEYFQKAISKTSLAITETSGKLLAMLETPEEKKLYEDSLAKRSAYIGLRAAALKLKAEGQAEQALEMVDSKLVPALEAYDASIKAMLSFQKANIDKTVSAIDVLYRSSRLSLGAMALAALALGGLLSWWLTLGITRPLGRALKVAETVAAGDLTSRIVVAARTRPAS